MSDEACAYTTGSTLWSKGRPIDLAALKAMAKMIGPPPPKPDRDHCKVCGRTIGSMTRHAVVAGSTPLATPVAYLCWRCIDGLRDAMEEER